MIASALMEYCAPTLAGIKTGNLFSIQDESMDLNSEIRQLNRMLTKKGLCLIPIRRENRSTLLYLYRPERLKHDLLNPEAISILSNKGYSCNNSNQCLVQLVNHLKTDKSFPHEVGLFLGYPPADVKAFMENPCKGVKCVGCWKAYGNVCEAKKTFERYKKCTDIYDKARKSGKPLEALIPDSGRDLRFAI